MAESGWSLEELADALCEQAAHVHAATARLLELVAEFDRREGWAAWGCASTAAWLSWRCGIGQRAARDQVRVARRLEELPLVRVAFGRGELSYSKARALCRMATPATEADLVATALVATAAQLETVANHYRRVKALDDDRVAHERRSLRWRWDDDGSLVLAGRLPAADGARLVAALDMLTSDTGGERPAGPSAAASGDGGAATARRSNEPIDQRRADALVTLVESGGSVTELVVHVDAEVLADPEADGCCHTESERPLTAHTVRRLACDGAVRRLVDDGDGKPLDVGRRTRVVPTALRRALRARDGGCVFPGCGATRWTSAHHVWHWADGGPTSLDNIVTLCGRHHRLVHIGGYQLTFDGGEVRVTSPAGWSLTDLPASQPAAGVPVEDRHRRAGLDIGPATAAATWGGERPDYALWIDALLSAEALASGPPAPAA